MQIPTFTSHVLRELLTIVVLALPLAAWAGGAGPITRGELASRIESGSAPVVLDVRSPNERQSGAIEGSLHIPLNHLRERAGELPQHGRLVIHCAGGYRSSIAASILEQAGLKDAQDLVGGFKAWQGVR